MATSEQSDSSMFQSEYFQTYGDAGRPEMISGGIHQFPDDKEPMDWWEGSLTQIAVNLHDGINRRSADKSELPDTHTSPDVIFLLATRAVPYGFALKSFWKEMYPDEPQPSFMFLNSSKRRFTPLTSDEDRITANNAEIARLKAIGERKGFTNAAVIEEFTNSGETLKISEQLLQEAGFKDVNCVAGRFGEPWPETLHEDELPIIREGGINDWDGRSGITVKRLVWNGSVKSRALMKDMQLIGHKMVEQARQHQSAEE